MHMAAKTAAVAAKKVRELTEEDLLKAPEKDYMNEAQLAFFRKRLLELRDQLLQNADDTGEHLRENEITTDPSDRATLEEEYTLELRTRDRERKLLKKIEKSLRIIDDGSERRTIAQVHVPVVRPSDREPLRDGHRNSLICRNYRSGLGVRPRDCARSPRGGSGTPRTAIIRRLARLPVPRQPVV